MDRIWQVLELGSRSAGEPYDLSGTLLSLLLAFFLGQLLAWIYFATHNGLSYSRSFVQSLILITVVVSMIMTVIGSSIITAMGVLGALAIIRFRNMVKDTRDMAFIFCALTIGMASGSQRYGTAILGTLVICSIIVYLYMTDFGTHKPHNGFLRFSLNGHMDTNHPILAILHRYCSNYTLLSTQDNDFGIGEVAYAYQLMIRNLNGNEQMLSEINQIAGVANINLVMQEQLLEV
jgi:uncharacterized membrane protein YhiD involved in acid resistance